MVDFSKIKERQVKSPKLTLKLEIELNDSLLEAQEAADRIQYLIDSSQSKEFSNLIVMLIRETKSSTWELSKFEIV
jgi:hypothetical protein